MKLNKNLCNWILSLILLFVVPINAKAVSSTVNLTASSTSLVTGDTVSVYVTVSSSKALGSLEYDISYDSSILKLQSISSDLCSSKHCIWVASNDKTKSTTYTFNFKAIGSGSTSVSVKNALILDFDETKTTTSVSPVTIKVMTESELEATYSKDNYLTNLSISGHKLSPSFNKNTTKYTVELDSTVESIKVNATKSDPSARVSGTGTVKVTEGDNTIKVVVTAENGSKRTYTITATVKELNPINITVDGKNYTVVKKAKLLQKPENYIDKEIKIDNQNVPSFYNEITGYTLVGLRDEKGNIELYIYNNTDNTYSIYKEYRFNGTILQILTTKEDIPEGFKETKITINEEEITAYKENDNDEYALVYALNINTGNEGYYKIDLKEDTAQRYNHDEILVKVENVKDEYKTIVIILSIVLAVVLITIIISNIASSSKKKKKRNARKKKDTEE